MGDEGRVCGRGQMGEAAWNGSVPTCERECVVVQPAGLWVHNTLLSRS